MRFYVDIDAVTDGRPEGAVQDPDTGAVHAFAGWVELLRVMERQCELVAVEGAHGVMDRGDSGPGRGCS